MPYDLHIVRTRDWLEASSMPITESDVQALIASDPELAWSTTDYVDMTDDRGAVTRFWAITWRGQPCFWWHRDQIKCSGPDDAQQAKLVQMGQALKAFVVGDDGEIYDEHSPPRQSVPSLGQRVAGWLGWFRAQRRPGVERQALPFGVGDQVRDAWGNEHTVISIDPAAEHGMGVIQTRRSDGTEHEYAMIAHGLKAVTK